MSKIVDHFIVEFDKAFKAAVENPENKNENGSINWDYVDADVTMDLTKIFGDDLPEDIYVDEFSFSADKYMEAV